MIDWLNDPLLQNIDPVKLELIKTAAAQTAGKSGKAMPPILMSLITSANKKEIQFSPEEVTLILNILKQGKSEQEQKQIDRTVQMVSALVSKNRR